MSDQHIPALRRRFLEDMRIKGLQPKTQTMYLRAMRDFTRFLGRSPDTATPEDLRAFQLDMSEKGTGSATFNNRPSVLSFFLSVTCAREDMKRHIAPKSARAFLLVRFVAAGWASSSSHKPSTNRTFV